MFVMLLTEEYFKSIMQKETVDTDKYARLTIALFVESRKKVDEIVKNLSVKTLSSIIWYICKLLK